MVLNIMLMSLRNVPLLTGTKSLLHNLTVLLEYICDWIYKSQPKFTRAENQITA